MKNGWLQLELSFEKSPGQLPIELPIWIDSSFDCGNIQVGVKGGVEAVGEQGDCRDEDAQLL